MSGTCGDDSWLREREDRAREYVGRVRPGRAPLVPLPVPWRTRMGQIADVAVVTLIVACLGCILVYCTRAVWLWTR